MPQLKLTFKVVQVGHSGYCSGEENEVEEMVETQLIDQPIGWAYRVGDTLSEDHLGYLRQKYERMDECDWDSDSNSVMKSGYCDYTNVKDEYKEIGCNGIAYYLTQVEVV